MLADRLARFAKNVVVLHGGMGARQSRTVAQSLATSPEVVFGYINCGDLS